MTPQERELVQRSFAAVAPIADQAAEMFYNRLFEIAPEARELFKGDMKSQGNKLMKMLATAVAGLNDMDALVPAVQELGRRHVKYGAQPEHYKPVGEALIWTLEKGLGDKFTPAVRNAWVTTYGVLSDAMIAAAYPQAAPQAAE